MTGPEFEELLPIVLTVLIGVGVGVLLAQRSRSRSSPEGRDASEPPYRPGFPIITPMDTQTRDSRVDQIVVRPAIVADVLHILGFIRALAGYEKLSHTVVATEDLLREHLFGPKPAAEVLIAEVGGMPVGFALFFTTFSTFLARPGIWLEDLFVLPEHRSRGVGRALLEAVAKLAVDRNCGRLEWSVLDWNEPAIGFYKKVGAVMLDDWTMCRVTGDALVRLGASVPSPGTPGEG
jgi:GNAT superfamily N-acetyltransferase